LKRARIFEVEALAPMSLDRTNDAYAYAIRNDISPLQKPRRSIAQVHNLLTHQGKRQSSKTAPHYPSIPASPQIGNKIRISFLFPDQTLGPDI